MYSYYNSILFRILLTPEVASTTASFTIVWLWHTLIFICDKTRNTTYKMPNASYIYNNMSYKCFFDTFPFPFCR